MQQVGLHLQVQAHNASADDKDAFARSAYNRYYYASFLLTRDMIRRLYPERTANLGHADYPEFLKGTVIKDLKSEEKTARRLGDGELLKILGRAKYAVYDLAGQFVQSNAIRLIADYEPETTVSFEKQQRFSLRNLSITDAHKWADQTGSYISMIEEAWKHRNV